MTDVRDTDVHDPDAQAILKQAYSAFNQRDIDAALACMTPDVSWPKASEGGKVIGKQAIRAYWTRQWQEFDPHVEPLAFTATDAGTMRVLIRVRVRQLVKNLHGEVLSDSEVLHLFTLQNGLIAAMDLGNEADKADEADGTSAPSSAFTAFNHRS